MTYENGEYIVRNTAFGDMCDKRLAENKEAVKVHNYQQQQQQQQQSEPLNESQQRADELVARHVAAGRAEAANNIERQQESDRNRELEQQKINDIAGYQVITPAQMSSLKHVIKQADWSEQGFCQKAKVKQLGFLPADRYEGAITWLQGLVKADQERRLRSS